MLLRTTVAHALADALAADAAVNVQVVARFSTIPDAGSAAGAADTVQSNEATSPTFLKSTIVKKNQT
jgi:hypothetical protein